MFIFSYILGRVVLAVHILGLKETSVLKNTLLGIGQPVMYAEEMDVIVSGHTVDRETIILLDIMGWRTTVILGQEMQLMTRQTSLVDLTPMNRGNLQIILREVRIGPPFGGDHQLTGMIILVFIGEYL